MNKDLTATIVGAIAAILQVLTMLGVNLPAWMGGDAGNAVWGAIVAVLLGIFGWKAYKAPVAE